MAGKKYTVAPGNSFTADGFIYQGGDEIPAAVFADKTVLAALVSKGRIIESGEEKVKAPEVKTPDAVTETKDTETSSPKTSKKRDV